ncbi:hypothetical protein [Eikenella halliae]
MDKAFQVAFGWERLPENLDWVKWGADVGHECPGCGKRFQVACMRIGAT